MPRPHRQTQRVERRQFDSSPSREYIAISLSVSGRTLRSVLLHMALILPLMADPPNASHSEPEATAEENARLITV